MLFLRLCEMTISLFSKQYFKRHFFDTLLLMAKDRVPNIRLKLCAILPRLKSLLSLPSDRALLQRLEDTVKARDTFYYYFLNYTPAGFDLIN
jgi:serine/threonine-protein phosphatase 4 regulatory subunit 4